MSAGRRADAGGTPATSLWLLLPLIVLSLALGVACIACAALFPIQATLAWAERAVPLAACATLAGLLLAIAPAVRGAGPLYVLPLWASPVLGGLGWALLPAPHAASGEVVRATLLTMPLMMSLLAAEWSLLPHGVLRAAAAAGASPATRFWLVLRLRLPGVVRACVPVAIVCLALIGRGPRLS